MNKGELKASQQLFLAQYRNLLVENEVDCGWQSEYCQRSSSGGACSKRRRINRFEKEIS